MSEPITKPLQKETIFNNGELTDAFLAATEAEQADIVASWRENAKSTARFMVERKHPGATIYSVGEVEWRYAMQMADSIMYLDSTEGANAIIMRCDVEFVEFES